MALCGFDSAEQFRAIAFVAFIAVGWAGYETYVRAPLASPVAWVVSLGPVGQARLQLKSCTRNSIFLDPKLFQTYHYKKGGWLIAEVVIVFSWRFV